MEQSAPHSRRGGTQIIFWRGLRPEVWNPYPYLRIFVPQKYGWFDCLKIGTHFKGFLSQKWLIFQFFHTFCEMGPSSKDFLTKIGPLSKNFWWKSNPFGWCIPVCLNMWVPPTWDFRQLATQIAPCIAVSTM